MNELINAAFSPTVMPATILLLVVALYWFVAVVGGLGLDLLDFDFDFDGDFDADSTFDTVMSAGAITLRFLNIGELPINIWGSVFAIAYWTISMLWQSPEETTAVLAIITIVVRNGAVALLPTKLLTQPLRGRFEPVEAEQAEDLIDRVGTVTTAEVTPRGGQARFTGAASPLLLNVRSAQTVLAKDEQVRIVDYDPTAHIYTVERLNQKEL
ncbi:MAG: NfeD family protein [Planctomycetes bacterium]|nr:NfeD family protein [Planctomycetota bacterium]